MQQLKSVFHTHTHKAVSVVINHIALFHLFSSESDHVQGAVHEATDQSLRSVLCGNDIIHPVVACDILQQTIRRSIKYFTQDINVIISTFCHDSNTHFTTRTLTKTLEPTQRA